MSFSPGHHCRRVVLKSVGLSIALLAAFVVPAVTATADASAQPCTAYVTNSASSNVTPIDVASRSAGPPIAAGSGTFAIVTTPDSTKVWVTSPGTDSIIPITVVSNSAGAPVPVGQNPYGLGITPDGTTLYASGLDSGTLTKVDATSTSVLASIPVGPGATGIAISPNGSTAWVVNVRANGTVTPVDIATSTASSPITNVGTVPHGIVISPDGGTLFVTDLAGGLVTPIDAASRTAGAPIVVGGNPYAIAITPDGQTLYVSNYRGWVTPINVATRTAGPQIPVAYSAYGVAVTPDGSTVFVTNVESNWVTPISVPTHTVGTPIPVGTHPYAIAFANCSRAPSDTTAPTASPEQTPQANAAGWNNTDVRVDWNWTDNAGGSGIDTANCQTSSTSSSEGDPVELNATCNDIAGNSGTSSYRVKVDKTPPTLSPSVSPNPVLLNGTAAATSGASDTLSGLASQSCTTPATGTVGTMTVTCTATDAAGNSATATATYRVIYDFGGFLRPVDNLPTLNIATSGQSIPVRFSLGGNHGMGIIAPGYPVSTAAACGTTITDVIEETVTAGNTTLSFTGGVYTYVWKTDAAWADSCRTLTVKLSDQTIHQANFQFR